MEKLSLQARPSLQTKAGLHIFCCKFVHNTHTMSGKLYDFISAQDPSLDAQKESSVLLYQPGWMKQGR